MLPLSKHRSEGAIPHFRGDAVVPVRELVMVEVMFQQRSRQNRGIVMHAKMHKQIPAVGDENAGHHSSSRHQIDGGEGEPYLPEDLVDGLSRARMMTAVVTRGTGRAAGVPGHLVAGKTGTTQDYRDAWFIGRFDDEIIGIWLGNDDNRPMKSVQGGGLPARLYHDIAVTAR